MAEIDATKLVKGITYRIDHRKGVLASDVGVFDVLLGTSPNVNARFLNVRGINFRSPSTAYRVDQWSFHETGALREVRSLQALGRQKPTLPNPAVDLIGHYLTSDTRSAKQFKTDDDKNTPNGVSQRRLGGRKTKKSKRRHRKTRRSRK